MTYDLAHALQKLHEVIIMPDRSKNEWSKNWMAEYRFEVLDGLRGVAAIGVLMFHISLQSGLILARHAYLAVDFFFVLSGFVIASAYEAKLRMDMTFVAFVWRRAVMLYPLIFIAAIFGVAGFSHVYSPSSLPLLFMCAILLVPTPLGAVAEGRPIMPLNEPSWSLFFEMVINVAFGIVSPRLTNRLLLAAIVISGCALVFAGIYLGSLEIGYNWPTIWGGGARVCFSFLAGIGIWRLREKGLFRHVTIPWPVLVALMVAIFFVPKDIPLVSIFDLVVVLLILPFFVIMGANATTGRYPIVCRMAGELSYPLYVLQSGFIVHLEGLPRHLHLHGIAAVPILVAEAVVFSFFCWLVLKFYDIPLRRWLSGRRRQQAPGSRSLLGP